MKTIKFNYRDLRVWNGLRSLSEGSSWVSPTKLGLHLGFNYNGASSKCTRSLKKLLNEGILTQNIKGHYGILNKDFAIKLLDERTDIYEYLKKEYKKRKLFIFYDIHGNEYEDETFRNFIADQSLKLLQKRNYIS